MPDRTMDVNDSQWRPLLRVAGVAALVVVGLTLFQIVVFVVWPPPDFHPTSAAAVAWFTLFETNPIIALLSLDLLMIVDSVLLLFVVLALYVTLRRAGESSC